MMVVRKNEKLSLNRKRIVHILDLYEWAHKR